jgi:hypothetical protein
VLEAVNFNDQRRVRAKEVKDVSPMRHLPLEFPSIDLPVAELLPKALLGNGFASAQRTGHACDTLTHCSSLN